MTQTSDAFGVQTFAVERLHMTSRNAVRYQSIPYVLVEVLPVYFEFGRHEFVRPRRVEFRDFHAVFCLRSVFVVVSVFGSLVVVGLGGRRRLCGDGHVLQRVVDLRVYRRRRVARHLVLCRALSDEATLWILV